MSDENRNPLRCLVLADTFPSALEPWRGPYNRRQIECLARLCRVTAIDPMPWPRLLRDRRAWALAARPDGVLDGMTIHHPVFWYLPVFGRGRTWRGVAAAAERVLKREPDARWDVILATFAYPHGPAAERLAERMGVPYLIKTRGSDLHSLPALSAVEGTAFGARCERTAEALRGAAGVVAVSRNLADIALQLGAKPDGVRVLTNGVDAAAFPVIDRAEARRQLGLPLDGKIILFVGSLLPVKGIDVLMEAFLALRARNPALFARTQLLIAGEGPKRSWVARRIADEGLRGSVKLLGRVGREKIARLMNAADVLALPSRNEGCPNVVLEALACGTPVVAARVGAVPDLLDESCGIITPPDDAPAFSVALEQALSKSWDRAALRRRVEGMSWEANAQALYEMLLQAVATFTTKAPRR
jgi:glycosyltransferase involved in cell wall biosynthesis